MHVLAGMHTDCVIETVLFIGHSFCALSPHKNTAENTQLLLNPPSWEVVMNLVGMPVK